MDPIMWDPFRYKLGGRLLNAAGEEFLHLWGGGADGDRYNTTRDLATFAIAKEAEAGRGSPHGGAWLSFAHLPEARLREAFGPVIDRLVANGIDLTRDAVEVSPIAHYHMGGVRVNARMRTRVPRLLAAGEAVGGANGANRLSGNAITEALAFGREAGREAAAIARRDGLGPEPERTSLREALALLAATGDGVARNTAAAVAALQRSMALDAGPFRTARGLDRCAAALDGLQAELGPAPPGAPGAAHDLARLDWFDLRQMLLVSQAVVASALARRESRGAHQREDFPATDDGAWRLSQITELGADGRLVLHTLEPAA
jgi:succinate dehydrogenase/fumarate reductase flavoprotein subunit